MRVRVLFGTTILLGAGLVFLVQPMFARLLLPELGGTSSVWTASMLFYTTALLAGYLYAHVVTRRLTIRKQALLHLVLLGVTLLMLPIGLPDWDPPTSTTPVPWLLAVLTVSIGLPFVLVSSTSPLLQRWLAETDHPDAKDPYFLYRASNIGSALGLLAYPIVVEPSLGVQNQTWLWSAGFVLLTILAGGCAVVLIRAPSAAFYRTAKTPEEGTNGSVNSNEPLTWRRRLNWVALAFAPASLTQGVTTFLSVDVAPVPLLWVLPLGLYLLSFVVVFSRSERVTWLPRLLGYALPVVALLMASLFVAEPHQPILWIALAHLAGLFVVALVCHGMLAADRPAPAALTEFYGWLAVGGALGTALNGVVAPALFDELLEYPIALLVACALAVLGYRSFRSPDAKPLRVLSRIPGSPARWTGTGVMQGLGTVAILVTAATVALSMFAKDDQLYVGRNFFGAKEVSTSGYAHTLRHGTTTHGAQELDHPKEPMTYYHKTGPLGQLVDALPKSKAPRGSAMVGLGTGTAACLTPPGGKWTFYEIDPEVVRIARDDRLFSFLSNCGNSEIVVGDARHSLTREKKGSFALIALDAFSSDGIPVHLLTKEAVEMYRDRLAPDGVLAFHISNRYLNLEPVLSAVAQDLEMRCMVQTDARTDQALLKAASTWVVLGPAELDTRWIPCQRKDFRAWTDDFSNLFSVFSLT